jgi:hypothetical protein
MNQKTPRPVAPGGAHRAAGGSEFLSGTSNPTSSTTYPQMLAAALEGGAVLQIGPSDSPLSLESLHSFLKDIFCFDDDYRHRQLIGPTAICAHWFGFTSRQSGLNHLCPATVLRDLILTCFDLDYSDIPMDAVLAGLVFQGFQVERTKAKGLSPFNWVANIRTLNYPPRLVAAWCRIDELGVLGAIPPIRISPPRRGRPAKLVTLRGTPRAMNDETRRQAAPARAHLAASSQGPWRHLRLFCVDSNPAVRPA